MDEMELQLILKKCKTLRQCLNPSNTESFVKWALQTMPLVAQKAIDLTHENEKLTQDMERMRALVKKPGASM